MDAQERVARILCRLMGDEWQQGERLYRNTADEIIATLAPASNIAPREAGIQAFYADESTTNALQGLNAAFDAYEAASDLRDKFAGLALAGMTGQWLVTGTPVPLADCQEIAGDAYAMADAMLAARSKAKEA